MKFLVVLAMCTAFSCSGNQKQTGLPDTDKVMLGQVMNPISAPSVEYDKRVIKTQAAPSAPTLPAGPRLLKFVDVKLSVVVPNADWKVDITPQGVMIVNEKVMGMVMLSIQDDERPLKVIADEQQKALSASGKFTLSEVKEKKGPNRAYFDATLPQKDASKIVLRGVFQKNPSNPKQTVAFIGIWTVGKTDVKKQVLGIISSLSPIP